MEKWMWVQMWQRRLQQVIDNLTGDGGPLRIAIMGVGHPYYADDAIGLELTRYLLTTSLSRCQDRLLLLGGPAPENYCGVLRRFRPDLVILIDAAAMNLPAGHVTWLETDHLAGFSVSSRAYPLSILSSYLTHEIGCKVGLLGVQPARVCFGEISESLQQRIPAIGDSLLHILPPCGRGNRREIQQTLGSYGR